MFCLPRHVQDVLRDVFKTSSRRLQDVFARHLQDVLEDEKLLRWRVDHSKHSKHDNRLELITRNTIIKSEVCVNVTFYNFQYFNQEHMELPNGHTTSNRCWFHVDTTSIRRRPNFDEFPRHFHVLFRCNFSDLKIHIVSTYLFGVSSMVQKSTLFSLNFFDVTLMIEKSTLIARTFFDEISIARNPTSFLVKLQANENVWTGFPLLVTLKNWLLQNFSPSTFQVNLPGVALSIKPWVLEPPTLQKELPQVSGYLQNNYCTT